MTMKYKIEIYNISLLLKPDRIMYWSCLPMDFKLPGSDGINTYRRTEIIKKKTVCIGRYLFEEYNKHLSII